MAFGRLIEASIGPPGSTGKKIEDLRMKFTVEKTQETAQNKCQLLIFNLAKQTATQVGKVGNILILRAGYEDEGGVKSLFFGDITKATRRKDGTETIFELEAYDGQTELSTTNISLSYSPGASADAVAADVISAIGLPVGNVVNPSGLIYEHGYSFIGKAGDALFQVLAKMSRFYWVQNQQIIILERGGIISDSGLELSSDTGMINQPILLEDKKSEQNVEDVPKRYEVETLMFPQLIPGAQVRIQADDISGVFKIEKVSFRGDNFEGDFAALAEVVAQ